MPVPRRLLRAVLFGAAAAALIAPGSVARAEPSPAEIERQIEAFADELERVIEQHNATAEQLKASQAAAADLTTKLAPLQVSVDAANVTIGQLAATAYKGGSVGSMTVLLTSGSTEGLIDSLATLDHMARNRQRELANYAETKARYDAEKKRLDDLIAQQAAKEREQAARVAHIEGEMRKLNEMRQRAPASRASRSAPQPAPPKAAPPYVPGRAGVAVQYAYAQLGKPYRFGGVGPGSFDCSGLTMMAWKQAGVALPHSASMQRGRMPHIGKDMLQPGDLFFSNNLGHVGMYVGNGNVIYAPTSGQVVKMAPLANVRAQSFGRPG